jgi:dTDP-4-dehydrorhamnose 3,5-epimerase
MRFIETSIPGVVVVEPRVFEDSRGFFMETYHRQKFAEAGITCEFVQDNHSRSRRGTLRGLHYQLQQPQAKLCRVIEGEVLDVVLDIRRGSPTFGHWTAVVLSADNKREIFVPRGFAHGFVVLSETAEFLYKCDDFYLPGDEKGILWNDPELGIEWGIEDPILSEKDRVNPRLSEMPPDNLPLYSTQ